jgi:hypothetical protein
LPVYSCRILRKRRASSGGITETRPVGGTGRFVDRGMTAVPSCFHVCSLSKSSFCHLGYDKKRNKSILLVSDTGWLAVVGSACGTTVVLSPIFTVIKET